MKTDSAQHNKSSLEVEAPPVVDAKGWLRTFSSLRIRNYRWYWFSVVAGFVAMQMQMVARGWLIYEMTDSPLALGLISIAWGVPAMLIGPFGGVITDRMEKRNLIVITQVLIGLITLAVTILIVNGSIQYWHLIGAALLTGVIFAFNMPARYAIIPQLVGEKQLMNAIALSSSGTNFSRIVAPAVAGVLIGLIGIPGVYIVMTGCYIFVVGAVLKVPTIGVASRPQKTSIMEDLIEGFVYIRRNRLVLMLIVLAFASILFGWPYMILMPVFARDVLDVGPEGLGMLMSAMGCGALIGSLGVASLGGFKRKGLLMLGLALVFGVGVILFAISKSLYLSLFSLFIAGLASAGLFALNTALVQSNVTDQMRGRVMAILLMTFGLQSLGVLFISGAAEAVGAPLAVAGGGVLLVLTILVLAILVPDLRHL